MIEPTTWSEIAEDIRRAAQSGRMSRPADLPSHADNLSALLSRHQRRLDDICEHWALTGEWMMMTPAEDWFLKFRLIHGWGLALRLTRKTASGETVRVPPRPEAIRWLISDSWLPSDDAETVRAACAALREPGSSDPKFRGLL
jgi:hypothetical protein